MSGYIGPTSSLRQYDMAHNDDDDKVISLFYILYFPIILFQDCLNMDLFPIEYINL